MSKRGAAVAAALRITNSDMKSRSPVAVKTLSHNSDNGGDQMSGDNAKTDGSAQSAHVGQDVGGKKRKRKGCGKVSEANIKRLKSEEVEPALVIWAKFKGCAFWPAKVLSRESDLAKNF
eukprot:gene12541-33122_t